VVSVVSRQIDNNGDYVIPDDKTNKRQINNKIEVLNVVKFFKSCSLERFA